MMSLKQWKKVKKATVSWDRAVAGGFTYGGATISVNKAGKLFLVKDGVAYGSKAKTVLKG